MIINSLASAASYRMRSAAYKTTLQAVGLPRMLDGPPQSAVLTGILPLQVLATIGAN